MFSHYRLILQTDLDAMHHYVMLWIAQANEKLHTQHLQKSDKLNLIFAQEVHVIVIVPC
jgi:hypothetical protein